jgi:hypothetical protein
VKEYCGDCLFEGVSCRYPECLNEDEAALPACMMPDGADPCHAFTVLKRNLDAAEETIKSLRLEMKQAATWASEYEREFGFKRSPPDFMFPF